MTGRYYVYRLYDATGRLLYIGCSRNLVGRSRSHASDQCWWPLVTTWRLTGPFSDKQAALKHEREAIRNEVPRFNDQSNVNFVHTEETRAEYLRLMKARWSDLRLGEKSGAGVTGSASA